MMLECNKESLFLLANANKSIYTYTCIFTGNKNQLSSSRSTGRISGVAQGLQAESVE